MAKQGARDDPGLTDRDKVVETPDVEKWLWRLDRQQKSLGGNRKIRRAKGRDKK